MFNVHFWLPTRKSNMCSRNPLMAGLVLISLLQPSGHFVRQIALIGCGAVLILDSRWFLEILGREILWVLWKALLWRPCESLIVQPGRSLHEDLDQGLVEVLGRRCCEDPGKNLLRSPCMILRKSLWKDPAWWNPLRGPCMILYRSLREDIVEILVEPCRMQSTTKKKLATKIWKVPCLWGACI